MPTYTNSHIRDLSYIFAVTLVLILAAWLYWPGLSGGFIFDDYPNLGEMERIALQDNFWTGVRIYLDGGFSGPTKRPVALASFLLEYSSWPHDPQPFKRNNILFHTLTTLLVWWLGLLIAERADLPERRRAPFALIAATMFALHPLHVSTVLYVVQRMTELSTLFSVAALITYLKGIRALETGKAAGWPLLLFIYPTFVALGIFSKEISILVAFFAAVITVCFPLRVDNSEHGVNPSQARLRLGILRVIAFGPAVLLVTGMALDFVHLMKVDPNLVRRDFTVKERLLTEPRVIFSYLYDLFVPKIQSSGLYHDNFVISKSLYSPPSTLVGIFAILVAAIASVQKRHKFPFFALGVLGYLAGHALESSYLGLELYFEHRNYMPSIFVFLGIAAALVSLKLRPIAALAAVAAIVSWLAFATYQQVQIWKNPLLLSLIWAEKSGGSERSLLDAANNLLNEGYVARALPLIEKAVEKNPQSARAVLYGLVVECRYAARLPGVSLGEAKRRLADKPYHQATYKYLTRLLEAHEAGYCKQYSADDMRELVDAVFSARGISSGNIKALQFYELGNIELSRRNGIAAITNYQEALRLRNDVQVGVVEVARLASAGFPKLALSHIEDVRVQNEQLLAGAMSEAKRYQYQWIRSELDRLERVIESDRDKIGAGSSGI